MVLLAACAALPAAMPGDEGKAAAFRLLSADADFARLGIDRAEIKPWEDGRRSPQDKAYYEWWYFDGLLDDGTVIVAWLGDNWAYGSETRNVSLEITRPGSSTKKFQKAYKDPGSYSKEKADTHFGPHFFSGDLENYRIHIDATDSGGLGIDLQLRRLIGSYRPATGQMASGEGFFAWLVAVPNGEISGSMTVDGQTQEVHGSGYHDHNWGNISPAALMDSWWWGRAVVGERTVIVSELRAKKSQGGGCIPLYFVATPRGVEVDAYDQSEAKVVEAALVTHPDPRHRNRIGSSVTFTAKNGITALFPISDRYLTSYNFLDGQSWALKAVAAIAGLRPWYSRFFSEASLSLPGSEPQTGQGTLEFFEFK